MFTISGAYNTAKIFTDAVDDIAAEQIKALCDQSFTEGCRIRIMPDAHAGAGCVIGFTANLGDKVIPNIVGVDIGCGMLTVMLGKTEIDFDALDVVIRTQIPSGTFVHAGRIARFPELQEMDCFRSLKDTKRIERSIGTLGGGNHFIEIDCDDEGNKYLVIHSGSRNLGKQVAEHYQALAYDLHRGMDRFFEKQQEIIEGYKAAGRKTEIQAALKALKKDYRCKESPIPRELCYLYGAYRDSYLKDMKLCQQYAVRNRAMMAKIILHAMFGKELAEFGSFETVHNYIDHKSNIIRKGAVSAQQGELLLIPINMRDGSLICIGKGNEDWNCSAPHGAGRLYSRSQARALFTVEEFAACMQDVYTTCICSGTLDESPMAYKTMDDIVNNISPTAEIVKVIRPLYNFKATG
ncbi:MAG: RtcB family protein [Clostridia bacterium]|nr:RtcB family protein [Clostridia bacterium]